MEIALLKKILDRKVSSYDLHMRATQQEHGHISDIGVHLNETDVCATKETIIYSIHRKYNQIQGKDTSIASKASRNTTI